MARTGLADGEQPWVLSDFHVEKELFRSATGAVMKAKRRSDGQVVVLKERRAAELGAKEDVLHEVSLLWSLSHRNVIKCLGYFWSSDVGKGTLYIVLEYADGGDLYSEVLRRRERGEQFQEDEVFDIFEQCCEGLQYLHSNRIVHRDVKTLNILRCSNPDGSYTVKLADLGVGRRMGQHTVVLQTFYGTPLYASPELCESKPYTSATDIWSLGVVLYELAALRPPFSGRSIMALAKVICRGEYDPLPSRFSRGLARLIATMLKVNQARRPSASRILSWLRDRPRDRTAAARDGGVAVEASPPAPAAAEAGSSIPVVRVRRRRAGDGTNGHAAPSDTPAPRRRGSSSEDGRSEVSTVLSPDDALQVRGGAPLLSTAQRQRLQNELRRRKLQARKLEAALRSAVEHAGGSWGEVASEAGFTFLWESETTVTDTARGSSSASVPVSARSIPSLHTDLKDLRRVHADIYDIESQLSGRGTPTTYDHAGGGRGRAGVGVGPPAAGAGAAGAVGPGGGRYPTLPRGPVRGDVAESPWPDGGGHSDAGARGGVAMSSRDARWQARKAERERRGGGGGGAGGGGAARGGGGSSAGTARAPPSDNSASPPSRRPPSSSRWAPEATALDDPRVRDRERALLGRAGSAVVAAVSPPASSRTSKTTASSVRYNPITGAPL